MMIKVKTFIFLLVFVTFTFAQEKCYFMERLTSIEKPTKITKVNCEKAKRAFSDMDYFKSAFGKEGNLIINGKQTLIANVYDGFASTGKHEYYIYMSGVFLGANPISCNTATSDGPNCGALEFVSFGMIIRDLNLYIQRN